MRRISFNLSREKVSKKVLNMFRNLSINSDSMQRELVWFNQELRD